LDSSAVSCRVFGVGNGFVVRSASQRVPRHLETTTIMHAGTTRREVCQENERGRRAGIWLLDNCRSCPVEKFGVRVCISLAICNPRMLNQKLSGMPQSVQSCLLHQIALIFMPPKILGRRKSTFGPEMNHFGKLQTSHRGQS